MKSRLISILGAGALAIVLMGGVAGTASAAPTDSATCVAKCAVEKGGQHIAQCAQIMTKGVSKCATGSGMMQ